MGIDLKRSLRSLWIAGPIAFVAFALIAGPSKAEQYPPSPQGEDVAFLQLGSVGELVSLGLYRFAAASPVLEPGQRRVFRRLAEQKDRAWERMSALLGEDAISGEDFGVRIPKDLARSPNATVALAGRFERLLAGLYLSGVQSTIDPPTRLLIGRHLATSMRNLTLIRELRGDRIDLRPLKPLGVQYVGIQFDRYLTIPGA